ncbi:MAG TPA: hypothetical protein DEB10_11580, partial [Ruminococcaceae bacterium]|nr:hypothetical protein [Oscillospiraceae bacterium]
MNYIDRKDIPSEYKWRLTDIYPNEAAWEEELAQAQSGAQKMKSYQGRLGENQETLRAGLRLFESLEKRLERVYMYAKLNLDVDNSDAKYQAMHDRTLGVLFQIQETTSFIVPELTAIPPETLREWVNSDQSLADFRHMIDDVIRSRKHVLSAREEQLM